MADFTDVSANRFQDDLRRAAGYKPIIKEDFTKAYARYKSVGVKFGNINKLPKSSQTDSALYKKATQDVLKWWKANKKKNTTAPKPSPSAPTTAARISRAQAADIIRRAGLDPTEVIGFGGGATNQWINSSGAGYIWSSPTSFYSWLQRTYGR